MKVIKIHYVSLLALIVIFAFFRLAEQPDLLNLWMLLAVFLNIVVWLFFTVKRRYWFAILNFAIGNAAIIIFLRYLSGYEFSVSVSESNYPSIVPGDVVVSKLVRPDIRTGMMLNFRDVKGDFWRKRVHAIAGDEILVCDKLVYVNGYNRQQVNDWQPKAFDDSLRCNHQRSRYRLEQGQIFVLGDNTENSIDSRYYGPIEVSSVRSVALYTISENSPIFGKLNSHDLRVDFAGLN